MPPAPDACVSHRKNSRLFAVEEAPDQKAVPESDSPSPRAIHQLCGTRLPQLVQLGYALQSWSQDIRAVWRSFSARLMVSATFKTRGFELR